MTSSELVSSLKDGKVAVHDITREDRINKLEEEMKMLIDKSRSLGIDVQNEITRVLTIKAKEYYGLTGNFYRGKERELW